MSYTATLTIDPGAAKQQLFDGVMTIAGTVAERSSVIWLHGRHLRVRRASASHGSTRTSLTVTSRGDDLLELRAEPALDRGAWKLRLEYAGEIDDVHPMGMFRRSADGAPYIFTRFEPTYARRVFPCVDEPDSKVPWRLTLDVPKGHIAVSNTGIATDSVQGERHRVEFERTQPLPPHQIAFGVGPFDVVSAGTTTSGVPVTIFTLKGRDAGSTYAAATATRLLEQLEAWTAMPFPFSKLDFLVVPTTSGFRATAGAGLITVGQNEIDLELAPSWQRRIDWIRAASQTLAHQWLGAFVTPAWWDDSWLNEGLARWMATTMTAQFQPSWRAELETLDVRASALAADALVTARGVRQPIEIADDIFRSTDDVMVGKGAAIVATFASYLGRDAFERAVKRYIANRAGKSAVLADFVDALSGVAGTNLEPAFTSFLDQPGAPNVEIELVCGDGAPRVELAQTRFTPPGAIVTLDTTPWIVPVCVAYDNAGHRAETCTLFDAATDSVTLEHFGGVPPAQDMAPAACPRWVMFNARGSGYYYSRYTAAQVAVLRDDAWPHLLPKERLVLFHDVVSAVLYGQGASRLPLSLALSLVSKFVSAGDRSFHALSLPRALERFVDDAQRPAFEAWHRATFGPRARRLGLSPRTNDDLDTEQARADLMAATAQFGRDRELIKQAVQYARTWRQLPEAIRGVVLNIATDSDPETFERVRTELASEQSPDHRALMIQALSQVRDPARYQAALAAALAPELDFRETQSIVFTPATEPTRALAERFYLSHQAEIDKRLHLDEVPSLSAAIAELFTNACDFKRRNEIAHFLEQKFAGRPGGEAFVKRHTERLDHCIASRILLEPEIRAWLSSSITDQGR